jgi:hypothetical protein
MFLVHPTLTDAEMDRTCAVLEDVLSRAGVKRATSEVAVQS